jgi:suppressor of cytokine signaling 7
MEQNESNFNLSSTGVIPLISNNSFELNAISLSDDSGFTSHTRENEHADFNSDEFEEFSQFDSDSGMSAENFHTIKKISSSIIYEPPLEFQDNYPNSKFPPNFTNSSTTTPSTVIRTTHIQSYASRLTQNIIRKAINTFHNLATKEVYYCERHAAAKLKKQQLQQQHKREMESDYLKSRTFVSNSYSIYGSDSFLNNYHKPSYLTNNKNSNSNINIVDSDEDIYDEPNAEYDVIYKDNKDTILCTKRIVRSLEKKKVDARSQLYCNTDELFYEKYRSKGHSTAIIHGDTNNNNNNAYNKNNNCSSSNINKFQSNSFQKKFDKFLRSKFHNTNLTPTTTTSSIFYSFCHHTGASNVCNSHSSHPNSKNSLNSRLSSSHNSLSVPTNKADDSIFITQAMSHDQLGHSIEISDFYNVPLDSDIYTLPIDVIESNQIDRDAQHQAYRNQHRAMSDNNLLCGNSSKCHKFHRSKNKRSKRKKRSEAGNDNCSRKLSNTSSSVVTSHSFTVNHESGRKISGDRIKSKVLQSSNSSNNNNINNYTNIDSGSKILRKNSDGIKIKGDNSSNSKYASPTTATKKSQFSISLNLKQKFCSIFRFRKSHQTSPSRNVNLTHIQDEEKKVNLSTRALPPLPGKDIKPSADSQNADKKNSETLDFAANIEKVRECGWYWGPLTSEAAEKILSNEPDGSFIVRDSSDLNYIFSLTVKLNGCIRHVRIEQEQGTFSFGSCAQIKCSYKSRTIKEFIENAVEHSRSGRYLFFLHRRPEHGPMRVQLLNPVSRFRHVQSLQHMCRFVILKAVQRKDVIETLPLPRRLLDYLQNKNFLSELIESDSSSQSQVSQHQLNLY